MTDLDTLKKQALKTKTSQTRKDDEGSAKLIEQHFRLSRVRSMYKEKLKALKEKQRVSQSENNLNFAESMDSLSNPITKSIRFSNSEQLGTLEVVVSQHSVQIPPIVEEIVEEPEAEQSEISEVEQTSPHMAKKDEKDMIFSVGSKGELIDEAEESPKIALCVAAFNTSAKAGIEMYSVINKLKTPTPEDIATFLYQERKLNTKAIGEFIGSNEEFNLNVLLQFTNKFDFTGRPIDESLRLYLKKFILPGEAQKIDRIMNAFAKRFCENNPADFKNADTAYILCFSLILLNTDSHNPSVLKKMTLQEFIRNNRGIDDGADLPASYLCRMYYEIVCNEIKLSDEEPGLKEQEVHGQITGKYERVGSKRQRFVGKYDSTQVSDPEKPNDHRFQRTMFLFNDTLVITKPKTVKFEFRFLFKLTIVRFSVLENTEFHSNMISFEDAVNGKVIISFAAEELKEVFLKYLKFGILNSIQYERKRKRNSNLKLEKSETVSRQRAQQAKEVLENIYMSDSEYSARYGKGVLRGARTMLKTQYDRRMSQTPSETSTSTQLSAPAQEGFFDKLITRTRRRNSTIV